MRKIFYYADVKYPNEFGRMQIKVKQHVNPEAPLE